MTDVGDKVTLAHPRGFRRHIRQHHERQKQRRSQEGPAVAVLIPTAFYERIASRNWILQVVTNALWKHILFTRGIVPWPVDQVLGWSTETPIFGHQRKQLEKGICQLKTQLKTFATNFNTVLSCGASSSPTLHVQFIWISLGSSFQRPRQAFLIDATELPMMQESGQLSAGLATVSLSEDERRLSAHVMRQVMQAEAHEQALDWSTPPRHMYVAFGVTSNSMAKVYEKGKYETSDNANCILNRTTLRRDFTMAKLQSMVSTSFSRLIIRCLVKNPSVSVAATPTQAIDDDIIWLSLTPSLKCNRITVN